jgi:hypothetical protein
MSSLGIKENSQLVVKDSLAFEQSYLLQARHGMRCDGILAVDEVHGRHAHAHSTDSSNTKLDDCILSRLAEYYHQAFSAERRTVRQFQLVKYSLASGKPAPRVCPLSVGDDEIAT